MEQATKVWSESLVPYTSAYLHNLAQVDDDKRKYLAGTVKGEYSDIIAVGKPFAWPMSVISRVSGLFEHTTPNNPSYRVYRTVAATLDDKGAIRFIAVSWSAVQPEMIKPHMLAPHHVEVNY